jgi:succinate dehydrogenase/fumarate reductase flavoprotein subunit
LTKTWGSIDNQLRCDVLVIGTEGTGARAALEATSRGASVVAVSKGLPSRSGATLTAGGETSIDSRSARQLFGLDGSLEDSPEQFAQDMIQAGEFLADQRLVAIHTEEAPLRVKDLVDWGARLEDFVQGPGHSYRRGVWISGLRFARLLGKRLRNSGMPLLGNTMVLEILHDPQGVCGALALDIARGSLLLIRCRAVILATGGAMRIFPLITAPEELSGDGMAMALRCGASLQDMEFPMFLPYTFAAPLALRGHTFPYDLCTLLDAHALNRFGERYMRRWDPERMERATRDVNAVAATIEIQSGRGSPDGGTYLSLAHLPRSLVDFSAEWLPANRRNWRADGFNLRDFSADPAAEAWQVAPACHFWNGGVRINERCETGIPGLFAAGEGTAGIHGANRLSGNGLSMTQVWGKRAGFFASEYLHEISQREPDPAQIEATCMKLERLRSSGTGPSVIEFRSQIRRIAGDQVGIVRDGGRLEQAFSEIQGLRRVINDQRVSGQDPRYNHEWVEGLQNENQLDVLEAIVRSSLERHESRGAMYRSDYPETDDDRGLYNCILRRQDDSWSVEKRPVVMEYVSLPHGRRKYGRKWDARLTDE